MIRFAVDTGPLVALLNADDRYHAWAKRELDRLAPPLATCEAVLTEACYLVRHLPGGQDAILSLVEHGSLQVAFRLADEAAAVRRLRAKFTSVPMSLADACLVRMSELQHELTIITIDTDFRVYRRHGRQSIPCIMPD